MMRRHEFINEAVAAEILELIRQSTDPAALADRLTDYQPEGGWGSSCPWAPCGYPRSCPTAMSRKRS